MIFTASKAAYLFRKNCAETGDLARIGFGQSIAVTGLQFANATAASINGGYLMQPYLVREIQKDGKSVIRYTPTVKNRTISSGASQQPAGLLELAVANGSGRQCYIEGCQVSGKTGTAQKFKCGKIDMGKYTSSFVGFFPASNPQYLLW